MRRRALVRMALLGAAFGVLSGPARAAEPAAERWRPFTATWTLSGQRQVLLTESARPASIVYLQGPLTVTSGEGLGRGFLVEMIGFDDGATLLAGRLVLTDERGDRIYSALKAEPFGTGRRATGTITGGSGRYQGIEGTYTFTWEYVVDAGSGEISVRSTNLEGQTRRRAASGAEAPR